MLGVTISNVEPLGSAVRMLQKILSIPAWIFFLIVYISYNFKWEI
jgi:hypothetical protein